MNSRKLKKTASMGVKIHPKPKNAKSALAEYRLYLERLSKRSVGFIDRHFTPGAKIKDPFFVSGSVDQRKALLNVLCNSAIHLKIKVHEIIPSSMADNRYYFKWSIRLDKDMAALEGMSEIILNHEHYIVAQDDYWDAASTVWAANPVLNWAFKRGKKKIFGHLA